MNKLVMNKKPSENVYFHPDFHIAMNIIISYTEKKYGKDAVRQYIRQLAQTYYKPLNEKIKKHGLQAMCRYISQIYKKEDGKIEINHSPDQLEIKIKKCPAISHIKKKTKPANLFYETSKTLYETIVEGTGFEFEMKKYDKKSGRAILIFRRKK